MKYKFTAKNIAFMGVGVAGALILGYIEYRIPIVPSIPGIKLGLSNMMVLLMFFMGGPRDAGVIAFLKTLLNAVMFSGFSAFLFSMAGVTLAYAFMWITWRFKWHMVGISVVGALAHNMGQLIVAALVIQNAGVFVYLPVLMVSAVLTGLLTGSLASLLVRHLKRAGIGHEG